MAPRWSKNKPCYTGPVTLIRSIFISLITSCLLSACALSPMSRQQEEPFAEQRIQSPVFATATECRSWLEEQQATASRPEKALAERLILTSWNAQKSSGRGWEEEVHELIEQSDILLLQEAAIIPAKQEVLPYPFVAVAEAFYSWIGPTGLLTASHIEPIASCTFLEREPVLRSRKASNAILFPLQNRDETLLVINIHSVNFSLGLGTYRRQLEILEELMANHPGPIIFGGDLNTWNQDRVDLVNDIAQRLQLQEVEFSPDQRARFLGRPLDQIYYRGLQFREARTISSRSSDHDPLVVLWDLD